jgi:basic membrane protein A
MSDIGLVRLGGLWAGALRWRTMRPVLALIAVLVAANGALLLLGPGEAQPERPGAMRVGLVLDVGGRGDKSFNDSAYAGLMRARDELGIEVEYVEPGDGGDRESALRIFAARGFDLIIGVGFIFTDDITAVAREYPRQAFAGIDYALALDEQGRPVPPPANVAAVRFREEEGAFLVGALAGLRTETRTLGFVGGMDIPLIRRFEGGYRSGVAHVCPDCTVLAHYAGVTATAFRDPGRGQELALAQYGRGADIIFHASGSTGLGVFEAARRTGRLAIGVDADQWHEAPGFVLTSMVKHVDNAVFEIIAEAVAGHFAGGVRSFGLAEDGVGWVHDAHNRALVPPEVHARVEALRAAIVRGELHVESGATH